MSGGGSQCGALRQEVAADPVRAGCCDCTEGRAQSASASGSSAMPAAAAWLTAGNPKVCSRLIASGKGLGGIDLNGAWRVRTDTHACLPRDAGRFPRDHH